MKHLQQKNLYFGRFRLDLVDQQLWQEEHPIPLRPKSLEVLRYLAENPERIVSGEELRQNVWADTVVTKGALRVCIREIRQALEDNATHPQFIETVGKNGYRFLQAVATADSPGTQKPSPALSPQSRLPLFVGREPELALLHDWFARGGHGHQQLLFVTGEAGRGKSALVQRFIEELQKDGPVRIVIGQCVELYGETEAYLPLLDALRQLARALTPPVLAALLRQHAPSWLALFPTLLSERDRAALPLPEPTASHERHLRELADIFAILADNSPFLLVLEDLHWSDTATVEFLSYWIRRAERSKVMILCSYRPTEAFIRQHPLRKLIQELRGHGLCGEISLELLSEEEVKLYTRRRLGDCELSATVGAALHHRSDGNALFMVAMLENLLDQGVLVEHYGRWRLAHDLEEAVAAVPDNIYQLILKQVEALSAEEQEILTIASVEGRVFSAPTVAEEVAYPVEEIEAVCDRLAQRGHFLESRESEEWPDGALAMRYQFRHMLYQRVFYSRLGEGQRRRAHRRIGQVKEAAYGERAVSIAGELALHFTEGRAYLQALRYHQYAAENALHHEGYREAIRHCEDGLALVPNLPVSTERARQELALRLPLATAQATLFGFAAAEQENNLTQAQKLSEELNDLSALVPVLIGIGRRYMFHANREAIIALTDYESRLLERLNAPPLVASLATQIGTVALLQGEFDRALQCYQQALDAADPSLAQPPGVVLSLDSKTIALLHASVAMWFSGRIDQAKRNLELGLARAQAIAHPATLTFSFLSAALIQQFLRDPDAAKQSARQALTLAEEYGFTLFISEAEIRLVHTQLQGNDPEAEVATLAKQVYAYRAIGAQLLLPVYLSFLAEAYWRKHRIDDALQVINEALQLTVTNIDRFWEAELHRLKGALTMQQQLKVKSQKSKVAHDQPPKPDTLSPSLDTLHLTLNTTAEAEACFLKAIEIARRQGAKSLELRAVMSLARLWRRQGKTAAAHKRLSDIYSWFTTGLDTKDLQEAKALLDELADGESILQDDMVAGLIVG